MRYRDVRDARIAPAFLTRRATKALAPAETPCWNG